MSRHWIVLVVLCGGASNVLARRIRSRPLRELTWDKHKRLAFAQTGVDSGQKDSWENHKELYPVEVGFDMQEMDAAGGISVVFDKKRHMMRVEPGMHPVHSLAWGHFDDRIATTGWSDLTVETSASPQVTSDVKMYGAGFAEGLLTAVRISDFYANTHKLLMRREASVHALGSVKRLFQSQISFWKEMANFGVTSAEEPEDVYWKQARYMLFQLWGVCDGYNFAAHHFGVNSLGLDDMLLLNAGADLDQLMEAYSPEAVEHRAQMYRPSTALLQRAAGAAPVRAGSRTLTSALGASPREPAAAQDLLDDTHWERRLARDGHCSALVRVADGRQELLVGHTTWDDYSRMTRIFKRYKFPLPHTAAKHMAFSSYPGVVSSTDDFYVTDAGLVVMDTSLEILEPAVWDVVPEFSVRPHLPSFAHVMITNRMAHNAAHWAQLFSSASRGAGAVQWMIVDFKQFEVGAPIPNNTLWVLEAIPGVMEMKDMSGFLRQHGYWPSFNRPFFDQVREASGHAAAERSHGALYSWSENPRAKIFASLVGGVNTAFDMRGLMSRNHAPGPPRNPTTYGHEISARMDLSSTLALPNGGIDAKVSSHCLVKQLQVQGISGPSHGPLPPFRWCLADGTEMWPDWPRVGLPDVWNFGFVQFSADGMGPLVDLGLC